MKQSLSRRSFLGTVAAGAALGLVGPAKAGIHMPTGATADPPDDKTVLGIYPSWSRYDRGYRPQDVPLEQVTHLQYAYLTVNEDGSVGYADEYGDTRNLRRFRRRKEDNPDVTMILSIGGFFASRYYSVAASTEERRKRFASSAIELMREYDFDGLNVDWQYPGGDNPNNFTDDDDVDGFTLLLEEVRRQLDTAGSRDDADYELSISAAINPEFTDELDIAGFADSVDRVNVMAYDYTGPWESRTGFNAPLYNPFPESSPDNPFSVSKAMEAWENQPIDASKLTLAFASYGRAFTGVTDANRGFDQEYESVPAGSVGGEEGTYTHHDILYDISPDNDYEYHWHDDAAAPFLYSAADGEFITYDNTRSIVEKARYVRDNDFGGMAMWDFYGDRDGVLLYMANSALAGE